MKKRIRNYAREYQERLKRAAAQGLSKSQARGHPRAGEQGVSAKAKAALEDARIQQGLRAMRKGETLSGAARSAGLSSERLRRHLVEHKIGRRRGRRWYLLESRLRWQWQIMSQGRVVTIIVDKAETASLLGRYSNAVKTYLRTNNANLLAPYKNRSVRDVSGQKYVLETRPRTIYRLALSDDVRPEDFYRFS